MIMEARELLCSLRFVEMRIMFGQLAELLEDYRVCIEQMQILNETAGIQQISEFYAFVRRNGQGLCTRPSNTFQTAANSPLQTGEGRVCLPLQYNFQAITSFLWHK
jgi:hypothetical protein